MIFYKNLLNKSKLSYDPSHLDNPMRIILTTILVSLLSLQIKAQLSVEGVPPSFALSISQNIPEVNMPQIPIIPCFFPVKQGKLKASADLVSWQI